MANTATRLITLLLLLQKEPNQKASALADKLGISVRTLHRYFGMLEEMGIPIYSERGPHGGFSLARGYRMPPLVLTPEEAVATSLGLGHVKDVWGPLYEEAAQGALAKLENMLPQAQLDEIAWARRSLLFAETPRSDLGALIPQLKTLRTATHYHRRVHLVYQGRDQGEPMGREVDCYGIVHRWGWWYVVGYCHLRQAIRTFRVDRILELSMLDQTFEVPGDFDVQAYIALEPHAAPWGQVRMRFTPQAAPLVRDDPAYWDAIEEQADGSLIISFTAFDPEFAIRMALMDKTIRSCLIPTGSRHP